MFAQVKVSFENLLGRYNNNAVSFNDYSDHKSTHSKCIPYSVDFICVSAYIYHTIFAQVKHLTTT